MLWVDGRFRSEDRPDKARSEIVGLLASPVSGTAVSRTMPLMSTGLITRGFTVATLRFSFLRRALSSRRTRLPR